MKDAMTVTFEWKRDPNEFTTAVLKPSGSSFPLNSENHEHSCFKSSRIFSTSNTKVNYIVAVVSYHLHLLLYQDGGLYITSFSTLNANILRARSDTKKSLTMFFPILSEVHGVFLDFHSESF